MRELARGAHDIAGGLAALRKYPTLCKWLIAPAVLASAILVGVIAAIVHFVSPLLGSVTHHLPAFVGSLASGLLAVVVIAALGTGGLVVFVTVAGVVTGPFNERLSEELEARLLGTPVSPFVFGEFVHDAARGVVHSLRRVLVAIGGTVLVLALGLVPGIGSVAALVLGAWLAARAAAYDCYDAVLARRRMSYRDKLAYLAAHRSRTLGLGAATAAMMAVPGLNLFALGLGAAAATVASVATRPTLLSARTAAPPTPRA